MNIPEFLDFIRSLPCHCCDRTPDKRKIDPHHCGASLYHTAKRNHDELCMPLCGTIWGCHRKVEDKKIYIPEIIEVARRYFRKWLLTDSGQEWKKKNEQAYELLLKPELTPLEQKILSRL